MIKLENWALGLEYHSDYAAPECGVRKLAGKVYGHPKFPDGGDIITSRVSYLNVKEHLARTNNTVYVLGTPSEHWVKWLDEQGHKLEDFNYGK